MSRNFQSHRRQDNYPRVIDELLPSFVNMRLLEDLETSHDFRYFLSQIKKDGGSTMEALEGKFNNYINILFLSLSKAIISRISKGERTNEI